VVHLNANVPHLIQTITARLAINPQHIADYPQGTVIKLFIAQPAHGHEQDNQPLNIAHLLTWLDEGKIPDFMQLCDGFRKLYPSYELL
jgi:hypothetical protein